MKTHKKKKRILIIVENLPVPNDRRVWLEATTLNEAGYQVSVISIKGKNAAKSFEQLDGIDIYRYATPPPTSGTLSFLIEFLYCWIMTLFLSIQIGLKKGIDVIHACNPPETFWLIGWIYKPFGVKFVFDHHDLSPEMYYSRFNKRGLAYKILVLLEYLTFRTADVVITTNETHQRIAIERGKYPSERIFIVRSGPDHNIIRPCQPDDSLRNGYKYIVSYLGVLNPQDGVDLLLKTVEIITKQLKREDIKFIVMGTGDSLEDLQILSHQLGVDKHIEFTGWVDIDQISKYLSTSDICVDTMPKTPYGDGSTMNKILEYMSAARPIVSFDLVETRASAQGAAVYAKPNDLVDMADKIICLLNNEHKREEMGAIGRRRIETELAWEHQIPSLLAAYNSLET
jgi:glycosyltransferase involved in cell wall biosynthesis